MDDESRQFIKAEYEILIEKLRGNLHGQPIIGPKAKIVAAYWLGKREGVEEFMALDETFREIEDEVNKDLNKPGYLLNRFIVWSFLTIFSGLVYYTLYKLLT